MESSRVRLSIVLPLVTLVVGCGLQQGPVEDGALSAEGQLIAEDTAEAEQSLSVAGALSATPALALTRRQMTLLDAVDAQSRIGQHLSPSGCVTAAVEANTVTYTFDGCTGPWGLATLSGTEIATFSPGAEAGTIAISMRSEGLTLNRATIQHSAEVLVSFEGDAKRVDWQGGFTGVTARGRDIEHTADLVWVTDATSGCTTVNGTAATTIGLRGISIQYNDLQRCGRGSCPSGELIATGRRSQTSVTLAFDGTTEITATGSNGGERTFAIECRAE